jgi:polysaccharide pyruvyl transferase WcaK-like protein
MIKRVSLIYGYGLKNAGDMAINIGAIDLLLGLGYEVKLFSRFNKGNIEFKKSKDYLEALYPNIEIFDSPFILKREEKFLKQLFFYIKGLFSIIGIPKPKFFIEKLIDSDLVIFNGGNLFRSESIADYLRLLALMYPLKIARKHKKSYIIFPQSASKINLLGKLLLYKNLKNAIRVWTREDISYNYLNTLFKNINLRKGFDLAFFIRSHENVYKEFKSKYKRLIEQKNKIKIAITLRTHTVGDLMEFNPARIKEILQKFERAIDYFLRKESYEIYLFCQTKKDKKITNKLYTKFSLNKNIYYIEEYDPLIIKYFYGKCNLLIGMRLHSIILALSENTPAIGYFDKQWGYKNPGMMNKFKLPYKYIEDDFEDFLSDINKILEKEQNYRKSIRETIEEEKRNFLASFLNNNYV